MNKSFQSLIILLVIFTFISSCKEEYNCNKWDQRPGMDLFVAFEKEGIILDNKDFDDYKFYCMIDGSKIETIKHVLKIKEYAFYSDPNDSSNSYFFYNFAQYFSAETDGLSFLRYLTNCKKYGIEEFYLENRTTGAVDTIAITSEEVDNCQALQEACGCRHPIRSFKLNGEDLTPDDELTKHYNIGESVYRLRVK